MAIAAAVCSCRCIYAPALLRQSGLVVLDGDDLTDEEMLAIAAEVNSETAFVLAAEIERA